MDLCSLTSKKSISERAKMSLESRCSSLRKHLSKSASELSCKECTGSITSDTITTPFPSPQRAKSAANPNVSTVLQRTSGFLSGLKVKFSFLNYQNDFHAKYHYRIDGHVGEAKKEEENRPVHVKYSTMIEIVIENMQLTVVTTVAQQHHLNHHDIEHQQ